MIKLKYIFTSALLVAAASASQAVSRQQMQTQIGKDAPAYTIQGKDSICQIFIYSPAPNQGLHLAYFTDDERWVDVGQLCASDYGPWGAEKKMYNPFVVKANDGTWRALWSVNQHAPQFAVAYSEDLITWRPQDYPIIREKGVKDVAAYQMDDGNFDIYLKTSKGKRYVQASNDFRTFKEDTLEASADEILWQRDTATIDGKLFQGCDFEVPAVHLNYIRSWFHALSEEAKLNAQPIPKTDADLAAYVKDNHIDLPKDSEIPANLSINPQKSHRISNKLMGIFFEDISRAADGGLSAEMLQNGDPATSKWAKMRADAGHPAPFNLKMIGIGNEDLISTDFEQRYLMICKAVKQKYPQIEVVGTVGPFHFPSSDYIEGWKIARENKRWIAAVDEHYYEQPGWFLNHQDYYDHYDRKAPKVYLGEYASRGANAVDNALAEGIHLCNVERNGDVVEMTSYAPLLCKDGYSNWQPDMIYFDNNNVRASESYKMQKMFGQHAGDLYISSVLSLPDALKKYVGTSVVKDSKSGKTWLKVVNALPRTLKLSVSGLGNKQVTIAGRSAQVFEL